MGKWGIAERKFQNAVQDIKIRSVGHSDLRLYPPIMFVELAPSCSLPWGRRWHYLVPPGITWHYLTSPSTTWHHLGPPGIEIRSREHSDLRLYPKSYLLSGLHHVVGLEGDGGVRNQGKGRYLSKTYFIEVDYLCKGNTKSLGYFWNSKKNVIWTGLVDRFY